MPALNMTSFQTSHLRSLESEAIFILREVVAQFKNPVLLFSGGKDSITLFHLAQKAFYPLPVPFSLLHIDTGHNFPETLAFRDALVEKFGLRLIIRKVQDTIAERGWQEAQDRFPSRNWLQTFTLLDAIREFGFDACIGGGRRDEERSRAKERIFSVRDSEGKWDPGLQRVELWNIFNGRIHQGENVKVFPISNWTELDVWEFIQKEKIELPSIYFAHQRQMILWKDKWLAVFPSLKIESTDHIETLSVRYRTVGDMTCTSAVPSHASNVKEVIQELQNTRISERGQTRIDDQVTDAAMEDRKKMGYF